MAEVEAAEQGTTADATELSQAVAWFESEGIPIPPELAGDDGAPQGESAPDPQEQEAAEPLNEEEAPEETPAPAQPNGWQARRAGLKAAHEQLQREHADQARYTDALLKTVLDLNKQLAAAKAGPAPAQTPQQQPEPEPEVDIIDQPDVYVQRKIDAALKPYQQAIGLLLGQARQSQTNGQMQSVVSAVERARVEYVKANPDFLSRAQAYEAGFVEDAMAMGMTPEQAHGAFIQNVNHVMLNAMRSGRNPIEVVDRIAARYHNGAPVQAQSQAQAQPAQPRRVVSETIDAALRAQQNGAARQPPLPSSSDDSGGPVTMAAIRANRVSPTDVRRLLSQPGGAEEFWRLAKQAEEEGV